MCPVRWINIILFRIGLLIHGSQCTYIVLVIESKIYENKVTLKPYCTIIEREICSCATKERSINFGRLLGINFFTKCIKTPGNFWMKLSSKSISQKLYRSTWTYVFSCPDPSLSKASTYHQNLSLWKETFRYSHFGNIDVAGCVYVLLAPGNSCTWTILLHGCFS